MNYKKRIVLVLPVYNEEFDLARNLPYLYSFLEKNLCAYDWHIVIAEQASTDKTSEIAKELACKYTGVSYTHLPQKGRGGALRHVWKSENADYYGYTDIDLSSRLNYLIALCSALDNGYDISIGSRLDNESNVIGRTITREIMSRAYNILIRLVFNTDFNDAQCGFKIVTKKVVKDIMPHIKNSNWFFDSELLIIAQKAGYKIKRIPIEWEDNSSSTVKIMMTVFEDLAGVFRLFFTRPWKKIMKNYTMM